MYSAITVAVMLDLAGHAKGECYRPGTATSIIYKGQKQFPTDTFDLSLKVDPEHIAALDWVSLGKEVLPDAKPLTAEERASVNEFFWSHFK